MGTVVRSGGARGRRGAAYTLTIFIAVAIVLSACREGAEKALDRAATEFRQATTVMCPTALYSPSGEVPFGAKACSPDRSRYATELNRRASGRIGVFDMENRLLREVDFGEQGNPLKGLAWHPSAPLLAVMYHHQGPSGYIAVVDGAGRTVERLSISRWYHRMAFADDGTAIMAEGDSLPIRGLGAAPSQLGSTFVAGVNYAWLHYGHDFGVADAWGHDGASSPESRRRIEKDFAFLRDHNVQLVRWFVFADGRASPEWDPRSGQVTGLDAFFFPDLDATLELASQFNLQLGLVLWDYLVADSPQTVNGVELFGHSRLITDAAVRRSFLERGLKPLLERYDGHPAVAWIEVMNEPEGAMSVPGGQWVQEPVSIADMQTFVGDVVDYVRRYSSKPVTLGSAWRDALDAWWKDTPLDLYQFHLHEGVHGRKSLNCSFGQKPVLVGEFPTAGATSSIRDYLDLSLKSGCAGALAWSLNGTDQASDFRSAAADFRAWVTAMPPGSARRRAATPTAAPTEVPTATPTLISTPSPVPSRTPVAVPTADKYTLYSPDRRYGAAIVRTATGTHYQVDDLTNGTAVLTTRAQHTTFNDIKSSGFCDASRFAAVYHYGHAGNYSWIGVFSLQSGQLVTSKTISGFTRDASLGC